MGRQYCDERQNLDEAINEIEDYIGSGLMTVEAVPAVIGLCVAALLVASSVICTTDMNPKVLGIPVLGFAGYAFAMVVSIFLTVKYLWSKRKKK